MHEDLQNQQLQRVSNSQPWYPEYNSLTAAASLAKKFRFEFPFA